MTTLESPLLPTSLVHDHALPLLAGRPIRPAYMRRGWLIRRALLAADIVGLTVAFVAASAAAPMASQDRIAPHTELVAFLLTLPLWIVVAKLYGLYDRDEERADHSTFDEFKDVLHLVTVGAWLTFATTALIPVASPNLTRLALFWGVAIGLVSAGRATARAICRRRLAYLQNTIIVGAGEIGQLVAEKALRHPEYGINVVGFVDSDPMDVRDDLRHIRVLGPPDRLLEFIQLLDVDRVVIAFSSASHEEILDLLRSLAGRQIQVAIVPRLFELVSRNVGIHTVEGIAMLGLPPLNLSRSSRFLKRSLDVGFATLALLALAPLFGVVALLITRDSKGPVLFRQVRIGAGGRPFRIFKFRTMCDDAEAQKGQLAHLNKHLERDPRMFKIENDPRVTAIGRVLRRYFLDELPQLLNVLRGEMSLIGPRPLIPKEARHVDSWALRRLDLKPGMTGLWQVLGNSAVSFEEMVKLDYLYVTSWSLSNDLRLLFRTLPLVARGESAVS